MKKEKQVLASKRNFVKRWIIGSISLINLFLTQFNSSLFQNEKDVFNELLFKLIKLQTNWKATIQKEA